MNNLILNSQNQNIRTEQVQVCQTNPATYKDTVQC